jgi:hypothetical protein
MGSLGFVDFKALHFRFCLLMWLLAGVLAVVVLSHIIPPAAHGHSVTHVRIR